MGGLVIGRSGPSPIGRLFAADWLTITPGAVALGQHHAPILIDGRVDQHPLEEDGVELFLEVVGGGSVEPLAIL
ncbi:hypothetical protein MANAM107_24410 [Actinomyces capricornis]|uniref:Uncharacterized protein n=1 Tax=Actinomyces capricornis TaxID=2755559 RepID=A0ABN6KAF6_9ACTO|nr:hypothetical protein MANAM107_24410 [Actinomyces capricornis]